MIKKIGFSGTQEGMSIKQALAISLYLDIRSQIELHHGDCVGADAQAHRIARNYGHRTVCHPPIVEISRAWTKFNEETRPAKDYIPRNHDIVMETEWLLATPKDFEEEMRSGTWSTIREARRHRKTVIIFWPDGDIDHFSGFYDRRVKMKRQE